ncbi:phospholipid-transporting ATPase [Fistulifera solaris]|uniref:P-type sodium-transporting ATPase4 n=1 Tax=Fistulifera solaris TaxID=1519565 RepID=A0A1Z5K6J6_FISSO|nr:phospholipid-transporting ATPase [Fistulifera solaris]|eukprot:GAX21711.1 phospholipid-transporting ATPase [Fistulifera solaris]
MTAKVAETEPEADRLLVLGRPDYDRCDNKVVSARYTFYNFLPVATMEQFRRFANLYFLIVGFIMFLGQYTTLFETAISPWTTWGPLAVVISISLSVEGSADRKRHRNDQETNNAECVVIRSAADIDKDEAKRDEHILGGADVVVNTSKSYFKMDSSSVHGQADSIVKIGFQKIRRMDIRQGHLVLIKNREMVPADCVLLASSNDQGGAYIETSSIDGETNLKLRNSPQLPKEVTKALRSQKLKPLKEVDEEVDGEVHLFESIETATKRIARFSALGHPNGRTVTEHPTYRIDESSLAPQTGAEAPRRGHKFGQYMEQRGSVSAKHPEPGAADDAYVAALVTEPPNASVHTFGGKLTLPPLTVGGDCHDIPLGAENVLLRGAVLRNTEWAIGVAFFTGTDTKLIQNSHETPPKFSQLDRLMNYTVLCILCIMFLTISYLASRAVVTNRDAFDTLFYVGFSDNATEPWPYLPAEQFGNLPPNWTESTYNWLQYFLLYITLLTNFVPLSLYVTVEIVTVCNLWFLYADLDMYDDTTDTRATARSTIITDLGRIQYIFSDKTGTLTQNVMRFKRCSVDGMIFGAPIQKSRPGETDGDDDEPASFHPVRQLLVGQLPLPASARGLEGLGGESNEQLDNKLTFNAEMFLRVMSLCHTVVVEKDIDNKEDIDAGASASSGRSSRSGMSRLFGRKRTNTNDSQSGTPLSIVNEKAELDRMFMEKTPFRRSNSNESFDPAINRRDIQGPDGAPLGYAYQAESPDEGALVSAASSTFGFQVVSRDTSGITLRTKYISHLEDKRLVTGLVDKTITMDRIAAETASSREFPSSGAEETPSTAPPTPVAEKSERQDEKWSILAVNKFDSDRKRMSILLRSPPELGDLPMLFCKGADSAMLEPGIIASSQIISGDGGAPPSFADMQRPAGTDSRGRDVSELSFVPERDDSDANGVDAEGWELAQMLGMQSHLGDFAREGLRTLVLGMRILSESECEKWMEQYKAAATSMTNRSELLTEAAKEIERDLHVVGATAIEDKLQVGVPHTISQLEKAGIKLWVLTGDKRETAIEIGYSTHVLTPKMHLTEVPDNGDVHVRTQMAMEFMRLIKIGKLREYQKSTLDDLGPTTMKIRMERFMFTTGKRYRALKRITTKWIASVVALFGMKDKAKALNKEVERWEQEERDILEAVEVRKRTRARAEKVIQDWLQSDEGKAAKTRTGQNKANGHDDEDLSLASEEVPGVFNRASSAKSLLRSFTGTGKLSQQEVRSLSLAHLTAQQAESSDNEPLVDEDALSLESFVPGGDAKTMDYDKKKRTILERLFAVDKQVRKGRLMKHMFKSRIQEISERKLEAGHTAQPTSMTSGPRALVIEGAALKSLLGDPELEGILFAVASKCEAVIACRVSPKQKALLVNLVRRNVKPEPVTLAIGDGANDVGMIQEAHVGIGISGKEGKQAVNASDFAISQFRFLEELILIHGRWNFFRLSTVVLFSFYKNAVMAGSLVVFAGRTLYSGTPLFDEWVIAMLNFVAAFPIIFLGLFDRCLDKDYVKQNPEVFKATRENELMTFRTLSRWVFLVFVHIFSIYYLTVPPHGDGGGISTAWKGLMNGRDDDRPGDGEGGDLKSVGTVAYTCMIFMFAYKVLFENKTLIHGRWPAFTLRKGVGEGFYSRLAYTWHGVIFLSIGFYFFGICTYQLVGRIGASDFSSYVYVPNHVFGTRSMSWMLVTFVPIIAIGFDVSGKVFSNMFYPTQTQIHLEIECMQNMEKQNNHSPNKQPSTRADGRITATA